MGSGLALDLQSYNLVKLVYIYLFLFSFGPGGIATLMLQEELKKLPECSEGVVAGIANQANHYTATDW